MSKRSVHHGSPSRAMELFEPKPNVLYSLDATAVLAGVPRRSIVIYCRAGLVRPVVQPPYGAMEFTEEAIYALRRIERLRTVQGLDLASIKVLLDLLDEVERLRAEVRFLRHRGTSS
ncbi:MAG: MerR family transcriptional regulator [Phycisphaerales bacterium]